MLSRLCAEVVTIERYESLAARRRGRRSPSWATTTSRCASGDGARGAPDRAPVRRHLGHRDRAASEPPPALLEQLAPGAALVCPVARGRREHLMRFRDGEEEAVAAVRFVPLVSDEE